MISYVEKRTIWDELRVVERLFLEYCIFTQAGDILAHGELLRQLYNNHSHGSRKNAKAVLIRNGLLKADGVTPSEAGIGAFRQANPWDRWDKKVENQVTIT